MAPRKHNMTTEPITTYLAHLGSGAVVALNGNCLSKVLKASVRGVYGVFGTAFISHSLFERPPTEDTGEGFICMSSTSIFEAARSLAGGMRE